MYNRDKIRLTCSGYGCRTTHNGANAIVGNALVITQKGGVKRKDSQPPLMNLNLFHISVQSFSIMQPWDTSSHRFSRTMQYYRSTKFLDGRQWLRNKIRCQVYKGRVPMCKGVGGVGEKRREGERERRARLIHFIWIYTTKGNPLLYLYVMVLRACKSSRNILIFWKK